MKEDKESVISFFRSKGIDAKYFPKQKEGKKPDFELYSGKTLFALCELKSIVDYEFCGLRHDPSYNKIQNKIHEASNQLRTANPDHANPNIVFFMNHTDKVAWRDLWYVLTGQVTPPNQPTQPLDLSYLKRLIQKDDLSAIDYTIWADTFGDTISYVINQHSRFSEVLRKSISSMAYEETGINSI